MFCNVPHDLFYAHMSFIVMFLPDIITKQPQVPNIKCSVAMFTRPFHTSYRLRLNAENADATPSLYLTSRRRQALSQLIDELAHRREAQQPEPETEIRSRLAREVEVLRRCAEWLHRLERGENVVVNLRPDEDVETEFVAFDRPRVVRVLERIAGDLDTLSLVPHDPHVDKKSKHDPRARHRHELAEPPRELKKLSHREQQTALWGALGLPPK